MRKLTTLLFVLLAAGISPAQGVLKQFDDDPAKKRFVKEGMKLLDDYFKADMEMAKARQRNPAAWADKQRKARDGFLAWLERSKETLGVDLRTDTDTVLDLLDNARVKYLTTKVKKAKLDYITIADPKGMERHEYTVLLPKTYSPKGPRLPLIISLHGRVINPKHPALKKDFTQRSRQVVYNNWLKSSVAGKAIIVAPTTRPNGFTFDGDDTFRDLQTLYRTLGQAMINYRVDWNRVFLEVEGGAMRATCEQTFMFAGFIVRDRVDNRRRPFIDPSEFFMFENLNGIPLCYIADKANWAKVGQPIATALEAAYKKADATGNLLVLQADRDVNDALGAADIQLLEFVGKHKRVKVRKSFNWRFFRQLMVNPMPFEPEGPRGAAREEGRLDERRGEPEEGQGQGRQGASRQLRPRQRDRVGGLRPAPRGRLDQLRPAGHGQGQRQGHHRPPGRRARLAFVLGHDRSQAVLHGSLPRVPRGQVRARPRVRRQEEEAEEEEEEEKEEGRRRSLGDQVPRGRLGSFAYVGNALRTPRWRIGPPCA
ncbi:MAG: hypothetical protein ACYTGI_14490 [Planctomycetota bacterium]|jgi:hypothetical protein